MIVILFRSKLTDTANEDGYGAMAAEMDELARTMPGFVDMKAFTAADGERLTVVWWENEDSLRIWRENVRHRTAQKLGRDRWYEYYKLEVAEIIRTNVFDRPLSQPRA